MSDIQVTPSKTEFAAKAAEVIAQAAQQAIQNSGRFTIALSGGSTPLPIYQSLGHSQEYDQLEWDKVHFFWGDERTVPPEDPDSNFGQAYQALLSPRQIIPGNIHRIAGELQPKEAAQAYDQELRSFFQEDPPRLDLVLLGMGGDGHTASLFPGTDILAASRKTEGLVLPVFVPKLDTWRISFTPRMIRAARQILFLVAGDGKAATLAEVLEGDLQPEKYPSQLFREDATWLIDQAAASDLQQGA
jgi:6-phosphogluconolactonase